jgi:hypothetical protein
MARKLPWLASASKKARKDDSDVLAKRRRLAPSEEDGDNDVTDKARARTRKLHTGE